MTEFYFMCTGTVLFVLILWIIWKVNVTRAEKPADFTDAQGMEYIYTLGYGLIPKMTAAQMNALSPINGMLVKDKDSGILYLFFNGAWAVLKESK